MRLLTLPALLLCLTASSASAATTGTDTGSSSGGDPTSSGSEGTSGGSSSDTGTGGTSSTTSSTGTEASGSEGASTGVADDGTTDGTSTTEASTSPGTDDGACGACPTGDDSIAFDEPSDGAHVDAPFTVSVDAVPRCPCYDCSCAAEDVEYVQLFLDAVVWGAPCYASPCTWEVTATLGEHLLYASANYPSADASTSLTVVVTSVDAGTTGIVDPPPTTTPADADTGDAAPQTPSSEGCGCGATPRDTAPWALAALLLTRRRRVRAASV